MRHKWKWTVGVLALGGLLALGISSALAAGPKPPAPGLEAPSFSISGKVPGDKPGTTIQAPSSDFTLKFGNRVNFDVRRVENISFDVDRDPVARTCDRNNGLGGNNCSGDFSMRIEDRISFRANRKDEFGELWHFALVLEVDGGLDNTFSDSQHRPGFERILGEYRIGDMVEKGFPLYLGIGWWLPIWDPFAIVDADDDPSIRLAYAGDLFQAEYMWTQDVRSALSLGNGAPDPRNDLEIHRGRVIIPVGDYSVQPTFYIQDDKTASAGTTVSRSVTTWWAGGTVKGKPAGLPIDFFVTGYTLQGTAERLGTSVNANGVAFGATRSFDVSSFFIGGDVGYSFLPGWRAHVGVMFASGDDKPFDNDLGGYTGIANLGGSIGPQIGNANFIHSSFPAWGSQLFSYLPSGHGIGPGIGDIGRDGRGGAGDGTDPVAGSAGNVSPAFAFTGPGTAVADLGGNGGFGRGDNPGLISLFAGVSGKLVRDWSLKALITALWFESPESIQAEIDQARCLQVGASACNTQALVAAGTAAFADTRTGTVRGAADISSYFGTMLELNLTWKPIPQFALSLQPSILVPGGAVEDMGRFAPGIQKELDSTAWAFQTRLQYKF